MALYTPTHNERNTNTMYYSSVLDVNLTTTSRPISFSTTPRISGFWATTPPQYIEIFSVFIRTAIATSIASCVLSLVILLGRKKCKSLAKKIIISLIGSLLIFDVIFFCELSNWNLDYAECYAAAVISQWAQLSLILWMNVLAIDIWRASYKIESHNVLREDHRTKLFIFYGLYAWGLSAVYVGISIIIDHTHSIPVRYKPDYVEDEHRTCWGSSMDYVTPNIIYTIAPFTVLVIINLILLIMTYINIKKTTSLANDAVNRRVRKRFILYVKATVFRDVGYIIGFIPLWNTWYIFVNLISFGFNSLLGFYIFVLFVFNKRKLKSFVLNWIRNVKSRSVN